MRFHRRSSPEQTASWSRRGFKNEYRSKGNEVGLGIDMQSNLGSPGYIYICIYTRTRGLFSICFAPMMQGPLLCFVKLPRTEFRFGFMSFVFILWASSLYFAFCLLVDISEHSVLRANTTLKRGQNFIFVSLCFAAVVVFQSKYRFLISSVL